MYGSGSGPTKKVARKSSSNLGLIHHLSSGRELGFQGTNKWWEMIAEQMRETSGRQVCVSKVCSCILISGDRSHPFPGSKGGLITIELF